MLAHHIIRWHKYKRRGSASHFRKVIPILVLLWPRILLRESGGKEEGYGLGISSLWRGQWCSLFVYTRETGNSISEFNSLTQLKLLDNISLLFYIWSMNSLAIYDLIIFFQQYVIRLIWFLSLLQEQLQFQYDKWVPYKEIQEILNLYCVFPKLQVDFIIHVYS